LLALLLDRFPGRLKIEIATFFCCCLLAASDPHAAIGLSGFGRRAR
jgi:hypothetical protein